MVEFEIPASLAHRPAFDRDAFARKQRPLFRLVLNNATFWVGSVHISGEAIKSMLDIDIIFDCRDALARTPPLETTAWSIDQRGVWQISTGLRVHSGNLPERSEEHRDFEGWREFVHYFGPSEPPEQPEEYQATVNASAEIFAMLDAEEGEGDQWHDPK